MVRKLGWGREMFYTKRYKRDVCLFIVFSLLGCLQPYWTIAQSTEGIDIKTATTVEKSNVNISIELNNPDWIYRVGEKAIFEVNIDVEEGVLLPKSYIKYKIGPEKIKPWKEGQEEIKTNKVLIAEETMKEPGFLRAEVTVEVEGKNYSATATAAFSPEEITPTAKKPSDFLGFWNEAIRKSKSVPLNKRLSLLEDRSTDDVDVYQVEYEFLNQAIEKFYGVLCMPKQQGKYPAVIRFPGAGWAPLAGDQQTAQQGFITLDLYIHGHPVTENSDYYEALKNNELKDYMYKGIADRDSFYYKNVILGCVRSIDLIYSLPDFNGRVGAWGSSQGGALSIITTSLEPRINNFVALCPAMCDFTGYLYDRAGGWPHLFAKPELYKDNKDQVMKTLSYYDVVNFAKRLEVPGFFSWGFNDPTTPPTSFYSAFNMVKSPKKLFIIPEGVHKIYPEQRKKTYDWLLQSLK